MKLNSPMILIDLIWRCPTFHVTRKGLRVQVELCEDGLRVSAAGAQRGLYRVVESLFKSSRLELPGIWIPHYLWREWERWRMRSHGPASIHTCFQMTVAASSWLDNLFDELDISRCRVVFASSKMDSPQMQQHKTFKVCQPSQKAALHVRGADFLLICLIWCHWKAQFGPLWMQTLEKQHKSAAELAGETSCCFNVGAHDHRLNSSCIFDTWSSCHD